MEEIVVVGSLIKQSEVYEGRSPVQTLDSSQFEAVGAAQSVDILASLTANTGSYLATQQNYLQGVSQFSLRGVGLSSTLTLLNGRRAGFSPVSNDVGQSFLDINTLPVIMIERVEILRDGASSTYGSQAVAGVANIVTRKDFVGLEISGGIRTASNQAVDIAVASGFDVGPGHIGLFVARFKQDENFRTEFDWMIPRSIDPNGDGDIVDGSFDSGRGSPGSFRRATVDANGNFVPYRINDSDAPRFPDADCRAAGGFPGGSLCRLDFSDQRTMVAAENRLQLFAEAEYPINDGMLLFSEFGYSNNEVIDRVGNMLLFRGNVLRTNEFFVPANHPFNFWTDADNDGLLTYVEPEKWVPITHEAVSLGYFGRPLGAEANGENAGYEHRFFENARVLLGLELDLAQRWSAQGYFTRAESDLQVRADRHWIAKQFAKAIFDGDWNPFGTRLTAPDLITPKTVAEDELDSRHIGKFAGNDLMVLDRFEAIRTESARSVQDTLELVANGDLFDWHDTPVSLAVGTQYRRLDYVYQPDPLNVSGEGPQQIIELPSSAKQNVWAVFVESLAYFGERAELQISARHEKYDQAGDSTDPKIAGQLFLSDRVSMRASWGSSFQAPSVFQAAGNTSSRTLSDSFHFNDQGVGHCTIDSSGAIVNRGDNFAVATVLDSEGLGPQRARSANIGLLVQDLADASISLDLWSLNYRDVISQGESFQSIVDNDCFDDGRPNDNRVRRDSSGQLSVISTQYENIGEVRAGGLDMNASYDLWTGIGEFSFNVDASLMTRFDVKLVGNEFVDRLGNRNDTNGFAPTPELRVNIGLTWIAGAHKAGVSLRYIDSYKNDEVGTSDKIDSWTTVDLNYAYRFDQLPVGQLVLSLGAQNLTDRDPPALPSGRDGIHRYNLRPGFDGLVHDIKGRTLYLRFRLARSPNKQQ